MPIATLASELGDAVSLTAPGLPPQPLRREIELDFIRGLAILLVMDFHSPDSPLRPLFLALGFQDHIGWIGVDIFFVLSGFLVGGLLMKEWKTRGRVDVKRFLIRRGFKIWPQYYLYLAVLLLTRHNTVAQLWGNLLNIQNYTGGIAHTWSLAVEEHAYLLLTLLMVIAARRRVSPRGLFVFLLAVCLLQIPLRYALVYTGHLIFLPTHARLDSIGYGVLLAILFHFAPWQFARLRSLPWLWAACLLLGLVILRPHDVPRFVVALQHDAATLVALSTLLLLYRPLAPTRRHTAGHRSRHAWPYRWVAWVGLYSYGIYLWHIAVMGPCMALLARFQPALSRWPAALAFISTATIWSAAIALGVLTTKLCELPALRLRDRLFPSTIPPAPVRSSPQVELSADDGPSWSVRSYRPSPVPRGEAL